MKTWTEREIRFLQKAYNNEPIAKIAKALLRSEQSIRSKVHIMRKKGLRFDRKRDIRERNWAQEQHEAKVFNDNAEKNFFKGEKWEHQYSDPINAGEAFAVANPDESDDIEAAKMIEYALANPVDNA